MIRVQQVRLGCGDAVAHEGAEYFSYKETYNDRVDAAPIAGAVATLALWRPEDQKVIQLAIQQAKIYIRAHYSSLLLVVGHQACAANPVDESEHVIHIDDAVYNVTEHFGEEFAKLGIREIIGIFAHPRSRQEVHCPWIASEVRRINVSAKYPQIISFPSNIACPVI